MSSPAVRRRHAIFIGKRLAMSFAALAVAPFFLAFRGAPTGAETLVFACAFAPLAAAVVAARTGRLAFAHGVASAGLLALALTLWLGLGCGGACVIAWLVAAQVEATLSGDMRLTCLAAGINAAVLIAILAAASRASAAPFEAGFAVLAFAYVACMSAGSWHARQIQMADDDAANANEVGTWRIAAGLLDDVVVAFDAAGSVVAIPSGHTARLGLPAADILGRGLFEHVHVGDRPAFLKAVADAAHGDTVPTAKLRLRVADTSPSSDGFAPPKHVWTEMRAQKAATWDGARVVAVLRDVEAAEAHADEVAAAQRSIEEAIRAKDHFLANMSHELRTPLNAIIGFSEMLASRTLCPASVDKQREYARIIHQSGQHLLSVVNSILDMSKIRSGTFAILAEPFDIVTLIDQCCDMLKLNADEGRVRLLRDCPDRLEEIVGDQRACKQILINLLSNAVKFTPEGGEVIVSARPDGNALVVSVGDNGVGIGAADLARLGDPFFQVGASHNRPFEGTGLGLSVVRGLVGLHGGTIALESEPGRGTQVTVRLPLDCRTLGSAGPSAVIETIPRRQKRERSQSLTDRRMKQSA